MNFKQQKRSEIQPFSTGPITGFLAGGYDLSRIETYLPDMDALFSCRDCRIIKDFGNTKTAVVSLDLGNGDERFVLKKFQPEGLLRKLLGSFGPSRALKAWSTSYKLLGHNIPIPKPAALVEKRRYGILTSGYFISLFVAGSVHLKDYVNSSGKEILEDGRLIKQLGQAIGKLHRSSLIHGDLKWTNILLMEISGAQNPILTDFDHLRVSERLQNTDRAKDLARFMADAQEMGLNSRLMEIFLEAYFYSAEINDSERVFFVEKMDKVIRKIIKRHNKTPGR